MPKLTECLVLIDGINNISQSIDEIVLPAGNALSRQLTENTNTELNNMDSLVQSLERYTQSSSHLAGNCCETNTDGGGDGGWPPYNASIVYTEKDVTLKDGELMQLVDGLWVELKTKATSITTASNQNQQQINDFGGAKWYAQSSGYELGATVRLDNGDIVKSTVADNIINPNVDMTGWVNTKDKSYIGLSNVDNTSDIDKPLSTATNLAIIAANQDKATKQELATSVAPKADKTYVDDAVGAISTDASKQYATLALANADIANIPLNKNIFVSEATNGGYWYKATVGATSLTKSAFDPVLSAKSYTDKLFSTKLTTTTNLNDLPTGDYYISKLDLDAVYNAGNFTSLGYPSALIKGSGAIVTVTRSEGNGTYSYQSLELVRLGLRFTRYGAVGGSFDEWALPKPIAPFTSLSILDNLNNIVTQGVYFVDGTTANNASKGVRSYPSGLAIAPAVIGGGKDKDGNVVQSLTQGGMTFTRSFTPVTNVVVNDWSSSNSIGVKAFDSITEGFKAVGIGESFWVYPTSANTLSTHALYKKASSTESSVLYKAQQSSPLDGLIVTEGQLWSTSQ